MREPLAGTTMKIFVKLYKIEGDASRTQTSSSKFYLSEPPNGVSSEASSTLERGFQFRSRLPPVAGFTSTALSDT